MRGGTVLEIALLGKERCIGRYAHARGIYVPKYVIVAECVLGILEKLVSTRLVELPSWQWLSTRMSFCSLDVVDAVGERRVSRL